MAKQELSGITELRERRPAFRFLLGTGAAEGFADTLTRTLLPILAVSALGLGSVFLGALNAAALAAFLILGVPAGALIDRVKNRGRVLTVASSVRVVILAVLAAGFGTGTLNGALLLAAAILVGVADVAFTTALSTIIPRVAGPTDLKRAYSRLAVTSQSASTAAAAGAGALLAILGMGAALLAAAVSYALSVLLQRGINRGAAPVSAPAGADVPAGTGPARRGLGAGFRTLCTTPALWALTISGALTNAGAMLGNTVLPVFILRDLEIAPPLFAALGMLTAAGAIGGAAAAPRLTGRWGLRSLRIGAALLSGLCVTAAAACLWLPGPALAWLALQSLGWSFLASLSGVAGSEVLPRSVAPQELASVAGAQRTLTLGVMPVAALLGGAAASLAGPVPLLFAWAALACAAAVPVIHARVLAEFR